MNQQLKLAWHHRERERNTHTQSLFPIKATHTKALKSPKKQEAYSAASSMQLQQQQ